MVKLGDWPVRVMMGRWSKPESETGDYIADLGHGYTILTRYSCSKCNAYIAVDE